MANHHSRRDVLRGSLALTALGVFGIPEWALPALAQGETLVPFTDLPATINLNPAVDRRQLDIRTIDGPFTPKDQFFTTQHYGHPVVDPTTFRLKVSGLVDRPVALSLEDLRRMGGKELGPGSNVPATVVPFRDSRATAVGPASRCARSCPRPA